MTNRCSERTTSSGVGRSDFATAMLVTTMLSTLTTTVSAQTWTAGTGSWTVNGNWNPATVPAAGGAVIVRNGGTAQIAPDAVFFPGDQTPILGSLSIGATPAVGSASGLVTSAGVAIRAGGFEIGDIGNTGTSANGTLTITGAGAVVGGANVSVGNAFFSSQPTTALGRATIGGDLAGTAAFIIVGQAFVSPASRVDGALTVSGDLPMASGVVVGDASNSGGAGGAEARGRLSGRNLTLGSSGFLTVGTNGDRALGAVASKADGAIDLSGALTLNGGNVLVGSATSGQGVGSVQAAEARTVSAVNSLSVGVTGGSAITTGGGTAKGNFIAERGRIVVGGGGLTVGLGGRGTGDGTLSLGGQLLSDAGGDFIVGLARGPSATGIGRVTATDVAGFRGYSIGTISTLIAADMRADGSLTVTSGGVSAPLVGGNAATTLDVGTAFGTGVGATGANARAIGEMRVTGGDLSGFLVVNIGTSNASPASATGLVELNGGVLRSPRFLTIGLVAFDSTIATTSTVGDGMLRINGGGIAQEGRGSDATVIGASFAGGAARGVLSATDAGLSLGNISLGYNFTSGLTAGRGSGSGRIELTRSSASALSLAAGLGGTGLGDTVIGDIAMLDSTFAVSRGGFLGRGDLAMKRSLMSVGGALGDSLSMTEDRRLTLAIDGLLRGTGYAAIDANEARLDGDLVVDFDSFAGGAASYAFDLIRSSAIDGIRGDFDGVSIVDLPIGYVANYGIVVDGGVEVWRLTLRESADVPAPATILLLGAALGTLATRRWVSAGRIRSEALHRTARIAETAVGL